MRLIFFIAFLLLSFFTSAQDQRAIDSLLSGIEDARLLANGHERDTTLCRMYLGLGEKIYTFKPDSALSLWQRAQDLAEERLSLSLTALLKDKYLYFLSTALNNLGYIYGKRGNNQLALELYEKSLGIARDLEDRINLTAALNNIGLVYQRLGDIPKCLEYFHKCLLMREESGDSAGMAYSLVNIGYVYLSQENDEKGLEAYQRALEINIAIGNKAEISNCLNNIGVYYASQGDLEQGLDYYQRSLEVIKETGNKYVEANLLQNIGQMIRKEGNPEKALENYRESIRIYSSLGNRKGIAGGYRNIGNLLFFENQLDSAEVYTLKALELSKELGYPSMIRTSSKVLVKIYRKKESWENALEMYGLYIEMRDSVNNEATQKATIRLQTKYEFEKAQLVREQEETEAARLLSEETSRRDNLQYSVIFLCLLVLGTLVLALGKLQLSDRIAEGLIFFSFLILFEFVLVLADPYIEEWSGGAPGIKLLFNAGIAALIFPLHAFFEANLKSRISS